MPVLQKIVVQDFRNISFAELTFSPTMNCICGDNGQGKTNLLDAIYYLSMTKSALAIPDSFCVNYGKDAFCIAGQYLMPEGSISKVIVSVNRDGGKIVKKDDKAYQRLNLHIGKLPIVMVCPADGALISESGEERRRFANGVISQMDNVYLQSLQKYNRLLGQRNKLLKDYRPDLQLLGVLDAQLSEAADSIFAARQKFAADLAVAVAAHYQYLSGESEPVNISYRSDLNEGNKLDAMLKENRDKDLYLRYTGVGVQRDDFVFSMGSHPIRRCGSQGQQKSFLVALKLAQYDILKAAYSFPPILLLDDVFDKLDRRRIANLLRLVSERDFGQIFITDTNRTRMEEIVADIAPNAVFFNAEHGEF